MPMESLMSGQVLGGSYTGTVHGSSASLVTGKLGKALHIGIQQTYVDLGEIRDTCFGLLDLCPDGYTLSFWINRAWIDTPGCYISNGGQTSSSYGISVSVNANGKVHFGLKTKYHWYKLDRPVPMESWHHIVMTWSPITMLDVCMDGELLGTSVKDANTRTSSAYNNFRFGAPNNVNRYFGEAYIDELLFWDSKKDPEFIQALFSHYNDIFHLQFEAQGSFLVLEDSEYSEESLVEPITQCNPPIHTENTPHPCRLQCMWLPWCGSVVYNGRMCKYYNVFFKERTLTNATNSTLFVKQ